MKNSDCHSLTAGYRREDRDVIALFQLSLQSIQVLDVPAVYLYNDVRLELPVIEDLLAAFAGIK